MSVCQPSTLARLVSKTDQFPTANKAFQHTSLHASASRSRQVKNASFEASFRSSQLSEPVSGSHVIQGTSSSSLSSSFSSPLSSHSQPVSQDMSSWSDQFARMQIRDPLSFTSEYQQLYNQYEQSQQHFHSHQHLHQRQHETPQNSSFAMQQPAPSYRPALVQQPSFYASNSNMSTQSGLDLHENEMLAREFDRIETELNEESASPSEAPVFSSEQIKFQQAASEIHHRLSPGTETPPELESKFKNSKFLGLMRSISDGVVTLKTDDQNNQKYTQLFSPSTDEVVGNEYFSVSDTTLDA
ncbi:LAME_0E01200g1_1 [Lachancea meyersii CBS 8951]|uniref:LAME_0E01200g1_1 n=1 Tax=Lachancea meyersii CBS 8951 TaxID=1266667 RepID=A0A1G4JFN3_9SACH|nr:LAME_0E01200g1_1 [Lachancea meyersii CBS 8951]